MEVPEEITKEATAEVRDRLRNPFYASWVIAFAIWNWRAILILIYPTQDFPILDRLDWIEGNIYTTWWRDVIYIYAGPVVSAALAVAAFPWATNWLLAKRKEAEIKRDNMFKEKESQLLLVQREIKQLKEEIAERSGREETLQNNARILREHFTDMAVMMLDKDPDLREQIRVLATSSRPMKFDRSILLMKSRLVDTDEKGTHVLNEAGKAVAKKLEYGPVKGL